MRDAEHTSAGSGEHWYSRIFSRRVPRARNLQDKDTQDPEFDHTVSPRVQEGEVQEHGVFGNEAGGDIHYTTLGWKLVVSTLPLSSHSSLQPALLI